MRAYEPVKNDNPAPFSKGDVVSHITAGRGVVIDIRQTGSGNWSVFVEFDEECDRFKGRFASIMPEYQGKVYLEKLDDPYEDVEFGTNILDLDDAIQDIA